MVKNEKGSLKAKEHILTYSEVCAFELTPNETT